MFTIWLIVGAALIYFSLLALTLLFFAGVARVNERWDRSSAPLRTFHRHSHTDDFRRAA